MRHKCLEINLFGACLVRVDGTGGSEIVGAKHKALFALLATAPYGTRTRAFLQTMLWGASGNEQGRQSLRRALSDIKRALGPRFEELVATNNTEVRLQVDKVTFLGRPGNGEFLEGIDIREEGFDDWLRGIRLNPEQIFSLFGSARQAPSAPMVPVVAVVPFQLIFGDPRQRALGDWLAEDIGRSLSRSNLLAVISQLSSRRFAQRYVALDDVRATLNADYCVIGSLRARGDELAVDVDLCDAESGRIMFTRRFDGRMSQLAALNEKLTFEIVRAVGRAIADDSVERAISRRVRDIDDHRLVIAGVGMMRRPSLMSFSRSRVMFEEAVRRAPAAAESHAWLAKWYTLNVFNGWSEDPGKDTRLAVDSTARSLDIDPDNAFCLTIDGFAHNNLLRRPDTALRRYTAALDLNPNEALSWLLKGALHAFSDDPSVAVDHVERARRLSPLDPFKYYYDSLSASAHFADANYERALALAESSYHENNRHTSTLRVRLAALQKLGRSGEARTAALDLLHLQPDFTVSGYLQRHPAAAYPIGREMAAAMRAAGIPD